MVHCWCHRPVFINLVDPNSVKYLLTKLKKDKYGFTDFGLKPLPDLLETCQYRKTGFLLRLTSENGEPQPYSSVKGLAAEFRLR